ncbi:MAG TPA: MFS transporter [Acidobacteriota bacterium]
MTDPQPVPKQRFPATFWTANTIELFERAAYYAMASFMVIFLKETLGMRPALATLLNGTVLWGLIYFLPILSGTLADKFGYKRSLSLAFVLISLGYFVMAGIQQMTPALFGPQDNLLPHYILMAVTGIVLIGLGGSIVKPCIAGTIQKTSGRRATLGFGIFYMVINIGSVVGRIVAYFVRRGGFTIKGLLHLKITEIFGVQGIPKIFVVSTAFTLLGLLVTLLIYREPEFVSDGKKDDQKVKKRTLGQAVLGIFTVLSNIRFVFFIIVIAMFWFLYIQLYNLMPLFLRHIDPNAPVELYTLANPLMIVAFQMLITLLVKRWTPVKTIMIGAGVVTVGMLVNVLPPLLFNNIYQKISIGSIVLPVAGLFLLLSIASMAVGEMMASPRIYEYVGAIAPKGQEGLYLGYVNLPIALASIVGGPVGGRMFEYFITDRIKMGLAPRTVPIWLIIGGIGLASMILLWVYDRLIGGHKKS